MDFHHKIFKSTTYTQSPPNHLIRRTLKESPAETTFPYIKRNIIATKTNNFLLAYWELRVILYVITNL